MGKNRAQLLEVYESVMDDAASSRRSNVEGQLNLFGELPEAVEPHYPDIPEMPLREKLNLEKAGHRLLSVGAPVV